MHDSSISRRTLLRSGAGLLLAGLATGLPPAWLRGGIPAAWASTGRVPTVLILATSSAGDPINSSLPGTGVPSVLRPNDPVYTETPVVFGDQVHLTPALWERAALSLRERLTVFHHRTDAVAHSEYDAVMKVRGAVKSANGSGSESLPAAIAQELAGPLGTVQERPICLGPERFAYQGQQLSGLDPSSLSSLFSGGDADLEDVRPLRDAALDAIYADLQLNGTRAQREALDAHVTSREQARELGVQLGDLLAQLEVPNSERTAYEFELDDDPYAQVAAAVALAMLRAAPVVSLHLPWGADNHRDTDLQRELEGSQAGMDILNSLWSRIDVDGVREGVTFGLLNIFGRTLQQNTGRQHNPDHNGMLLAGPNVLGGLIGGIDADRRCMAFDPTTGQAGTGGVQPSESFAAAAATMMAAAGVADDRVAERVPAGVIVPAAVI